jgi:hypothetical protein
VLLSGGPSGGDKATADAAEVAPRPASSGDDAAAAKSAAPGESGDDQPVERPPVRTPPPN